MRKIEHKYDEIVTAMFNRFADWQRGAVIPWSEIELCMGRGRYEEGGMQIVKRFRARMLNDREIVTIAKDTVGIRLLTHEEAAREVPVRRQKRAYRQVNRGLRETSAVDGAVLPDALRLALVKQRANMTRQRLEIGRSRREMLSGRKSPTHPVRRVAVGV